MLKRMISLLLCLCLFPLGALAESALRTTFRLSFDMDPGSYPEADYTMVKPLAETLNLVTLEGELLQQNDRFYLDTDLLIHDAERTRTNFSVDGDKNRWALRSSLLGGETLSISLLPLLEFAIKTYSHMDIPLQRAAIWASPSVHENSLLPLWKAAEPYLMQARTQGYLSYDDACMMASDVSQVAASSREFTYWAKAMLMETGYDDLLIDAMSSLEDWVAAIVPPDTGIVIEAASQPNQPERWKIGEQTIFETLKIANGRQRIHLFLPNTPMGTLSIILNVQQANALLQLDAAVSLLDAYGTMILRLQLNGSLPCTFPMQNPFRILWSAEGSMVGEHGIRLLFEGEPTLQGMTIRQLDAYGERTMLTITAELHTEPADALPPLTHEGVDLVTISNDELNGLVKRIAIPVAIGLLPILAEIPNHTMQQLMNLLDDSGILEMLLEGFSSEDEFSEEDAAYWDEEFPSDTGVLDNSDAAYEIIW